MKLSAIICTHNRSKLLTDLVQSFNKQTGISKNNTEIIIVASACIDDTVQAINKIESSINAIVKVINVPEPGLSLARNHGLIAAENNLIAFLDDDIRLLPGWLKGIQDAFSSHECDILGGKISLWLDEVVEPHWMHHYHRRLLGLNEHGDKIKSISSSNIFGGNFVIKRSVYQQIGGFSTTFGRIGGERLAGEEADYFMRATKSGFKFIYAPAVAVEHLVNKERASIEYLTKSAFGVGQSKILLPDRIANISIPLIFEKINLLMNETILELEKENSPVDHMFHKTRRFDILGECIGLLKYLFGNVDMPGAGGVSILELNRIISQFHESITNIKQPSSPAKSIGSSSNTTSITTQTEVKTTLSGAVPAKFKISVIIPCYNVEKLILAALDSLAKQTLSQDDFEVICINDCSTDATTKVIQQYVGRIKNLTLINFHKNKKQGAARNAGLDNAKGEYVTFLDADDYFEINALELLINNAQGAELVVAQHTRIELNNKNSTKKSSRLIQKNIEMAALDGTLGWWPFCLLISKATIDKHDIKFRENVSFEDIDFVIRLASHVKKHKLINEHIYNYIYRDGSTVNNLDAKKLTDSAKAVAVVFDLIGDTEEKKNAWSAASSTWLFQQFERISNKGQNSLERLNLFNKLHEEITTHELWDKLNSGLKNKVMNLAAKEIENQSGKNFDGMNHRLKLANRLFALKNFSMAESIYRDIHAANPCFKSLEYNISLCKNRIASTSSAMNDFNSNRPLIAETIDYLFIPHNHYHAKSFINLALALNDNGLKCKLLRVAPPHPDEGAYLPEYDGLYIKLSEFCDKQVLPRAFVVMNDWETRIASKLTEWANARGIATYALVEGVNDFHDVDTRLNRRAYQRVQNLFLNGRFDKKYFDSSKQRLEIVGIERVDVLFNTVKQKMAKQKKVRAVVNCNFTYGVLADKAEGWVADVAAACVDTATEITISKHPEDKTNIGSLTVSTIPLYEDLMESEIFITRFSGAVFEALVAKCKVIYYNPGIEKIDKFTSPMGAYLYANSKVELVNAIKKIKLGWLPTTHDFLELHTGSKYEDIGSAGFSTKKTVQFLLDDAPSNTARLTDAMSHGECYFDESFENWRKTMAKFIQQ